MMVMCIKMSTEALWGPVKGGCRRKPRGARRKVRRRPQPQPPQRTRLLFTIEPAHPGGRVGGWVVGAAGLRSVPRGGGGYPQVPLGGGRVPSGLFWPFQLPLGPFYDRPPGGGVGVSVGRSGRAGDGKPTSLRLWAGNPRSSGEGGGVPRGFLGPTESRNIFLKLL